jgi:hypothetical protein
MTDSKPEDDEIVQGDPDPDEEGGPDVANDEVIDAPPDPQEEDKP